MELDLVPEEGSHVAEILDVKLLEELGQVQQVVDHIQV